MIARSIAFLTLLGAALASYRAFEGVDPNTLSCDPEGQIFLLLPSFDDCNKFYMCANGVEVEFKCDAELIFDFVEQTCNWKWAATCQLRDPQDIEDIEGSGDIEELWAPQPDDDAPVDILESLSKGQQLTPVVSSVPKFGSILNCNSADSASRHIPYRGDCQRYWRCESGLPQVAFCSDGLFFNERTQQCDFEANSKCLDSQPNELGGEFIEYK